MAFDWQHLEELGSAWQRLATLGSSIFHLDRAVLMGSLANSAQLGAVANRHLLTTYKSERRPVAQSPRTSKPSTAATKKLIDAHSASATFKPIVVFGGISTPLTSKSGGVCCKSWKTIDGSSLVASLMTA